jgi:hypothetical protein
MALASEHFRRHDQKLSRPSLERASWCASSLALGLIGGILIAYFLLATASAKSERPSSAEDESLQARVAKIKQALAKSSASAKINAPGPMWYNWNNWPNWGNWNNWPNWGNWLNW